MGIDHYDNFKRFYLFIEAESDKIVKEKSVSFDTGNLQLKYMY